MRRNESHSLVFRQSTLYLQCKLIEPNLAKATKWFDAVYSDGNHIHLPYNEDREDPVYMTEYFRVGGWQWIPSVRMPMERFIHFASL